MPRTKSVKVSARESYFSVSDYIDIDEKSDYDTERHIRASQPPSNPTIYKCITEHDHRQHKFYKPTSNRSWILSFFLVAIALCILLLEIADHTYPNKADVPKLEARHLSINSRALFHAREENSTGSSAENTVSVVDTTSEPVSQATPASTPSSTANSTPVPVSITPTSDESTIHSTTILSSSEVIATTPVSDKNKVSTTSAQDISDPPTTVTVGQPNQGDQLTDKTKTTTTGPGSYQPAPESQLTITPTSKTDQSTLAPNRGDQVTITTSSSQSVSTQPSVAPSAIKESQISIATKTVGDPNKDDQITITSQQSKPAGPNSGDQVSITTSNQGTLAPNRGDQVSITTSPSEPISEPVIASSAIKESQLSIASGGQTPQPQKGDQVTVTTSPQGSQGSPATTGTLVGAPNPADQVSIQSATSGASQAAAQNQVSASQVSTTSAAGAVVLAGVASIVSGSLIKSGTAVVGTVPQSAAAASVVSGSLIVTGTSVLGTVKQDAVSGTYAGVAAIGSITLTDSAGKPTATVGYTGDVVVTGANGKSTTISYNGDIVLTDSKGVATQTLSNAVIMTDSNGKATGTLSYADSIVMTDSNGTPTKTVLYTGTATQVAAVDSTSAAAVDSKHAFAKVPAFTQWSYFLAMYLPNILGVILQSSWLVVFVTFKLMEPFYQLASPGGASAEASLTADYLATGLSTSIFKTAAEGHWVLILAGMVQLGLSLAMLFVTDTMDVVATAYCKTEYSDNQPCEPKWVVNISNVRLVEIFLVACFSMIIMIIVLNRNRVSGVYSDPSRISTMADVLVHKPLIHELRDIPPMANKTNIALELRDNRYMLGTFVDHGKEHYGIVKLETTLSRSEIFKKEPFYKSAYRRLGALTERTTEAVNNSTPFLPDFLCMSLTIALFALILSYYKIHSKPGHNSFNDWMNSKEKGPGLLLTVLGISVGFLVKRKERYFRLSHSYVLLGAGPVPAHKSVTTSTHATPFDSLYKSATSGHVSLALLSMAAIFTDVILILVPTIPFRPSQTATVYLSSTYIVLILSAIVFVVTAFLTWKEWNAGHRYNDCPETLAAVLMRLCGSRFVDEKNLLAEGPWSSATRARTVNGDGDYQWDRNHDHDEAQRVRYGGVDGGRKYTYAVLEGVDGVQRHMVEEDVHVGPGLLRH